MSIIQFNSNGDRELVACGLSIEDAVEVKSALAYHFSANAVGRATIVTDKVAAGIFPAAEVVEAYK